MGVFKYERLTGNSDFRLLKLQPGQDADPLVSDLLDSSLDDRSYIWTALSYTWGNAQERGELLCNGCILSITANLYSALQRLRLIDKPILLWADAICINQDDNEEKATQVRLMRRIYKSANLVVADLGDAGDEFEDVATIFNALVDITKTSLALIAICSSILRTSIAGRCQLCCGQGEMWRPGRNEACFTFFAPWLLFVTLPTNEI